MARRARNTTRETHDVSAPADWTLEVLPEQVCFIIVKAREFDAKDALTDPEESSNASDDKMIEVLEDHPDDPVRQEIVEFVRALSQDAQIDLVTLARLGRGDADRDDWDDLRAEAAAQYNNRTASYLLGMPLLADFLEEALDQFGQSCADLEAEHL
jgi:hypothetical protein